MAHPADDLKTKAELLEELKGLRERLAAREEMLQAIQEGEVDAFVLTTPKGPRVFTIQTADHSYRRLVEEMQQGAMILSSGGIILYANQSFSNLLGVPIETITGTPFQTFFSPQDSQLIETHLKSPNWDQHNTLELCLSSPQGLEIPIYITLSSLEIDDTLMTCVIVTDLTQRKRYEATLANERLARLILDQAGEAILVCDSQGIVIRASQVASQLWGMTLLRQPFAALGIRVLDPTTVTEDSPTPHPSAPHPVAPPAPHQQQSAQPQFFDINPILKGHKIQGLEVEVEDQNGQTLSLILSARPLNNAAQRNLGAVVLLTDITDRKHLELQWRKTLLALEKSQQELELRVAERTAELRQANTELQDTTRLAEAASRAKSEFLANMSHEIRTPMNAVLGFTDLLKPLVTDPIAHNYLETIATSGRTLLSLINDILDLSKIEAGRLEINPEPVDIRVLVQGIYAMFQQKAANAGLDLQYSIDPIVPSVLQLDEVRMRQVLFNVVGNALKFTEQGYVKVRVAPWLHTVNSDTHMGLAIEVQDTGIGIAPQDQPKVFAAFTQSEGQSTRKYGGTGLGLTITQRLVELMQGEITLVSQLGQGSTFTFRFPKIEIADPGCLLPTAPTSDTDLDQFAPVRILVADDVASNRALLAGYFRNTSHDLKFAMDGLEAVRLAQSWQPDLILMDLRMPSLDGLEASKYLKAQETTCHIPIVIITASAKPKDEGQLRQMCEGMLTKPVSKAHLVVALTPLLPKLPRPLRAEATPGPFRPLGHPPLEPSPLALPLPLLTELSLAQQQRIRQELQAIATTEWEHVYSVLAIQDVETFIEHLDQVAVAIPYAPLVTYVETLKAQLDEFDWERLPDTIGHFTQVLKSILDSTF